MLLRYLKILALYIYNLFINHRDLDGEIITVYDMNICKIKYNSFCYKIERIKGVIKPVYISKKLYNQILNEIKNNIIHKKYKIKRLKKNESIIIYQNDELVNNTVNNIIIFNTIMK